VLVSKEITPSLELTIDKLWDDAQLCVATGAEPAFNMAGLFTENGRIFLQDVDYDVNIAGYVSCKQDQFVLTGAIIYTEPCSLLRMKQYVIQGECCDVQYVHPVDVGDFVYFETSDNVDVEPLTGIVKSIDFETNVVDILQCYEGGEPQIDFPFKIQRYKVWSFYT
jgi:hypothetical protein